jgi:hypothetical protein
MYKEAAASSAVSPGEGTVLGYEGQEKRRGRNIGVGDDDDFKKTMMMIIMMMIMMTMIMIWALHLSAVSVLLLEGAIRRVLSGAVLPEATKAALFLMMMTMMMMTMMIMMTRMMRTMRTMRMMMRW